MASANRYITYETIYIDGACSGNPGIEDGSCYLDPPNEPILLNGGENNN